MPHTHSLHPHITSDLMVIKSSRDDDKMNMCVCVCVFAALCIFSLISNNKHSREKCKRKKNERETYSPTHECDRQSCKCLEGHYAIGYIWKPFWCKLHEIFLLFARCTCYLLVRIWSGSSTKTPWIFMMKQRILLCTLWIAYRNEIILTGPFRRMTHEGDWENELSASMTHS